MPRQKAIGEVEESNEAVVDIASNDSANDIIKIISSISDISEEPKTVSKNTRPTQIPIDKMVTCRSICFGGLTYRSEKTSAKYRWPRMNSVEDLTFGELREMHNNKKAYLEKPLIIVEDADVVAYFRLEEIYRKVSQIDDLKNVLKGNIEEMNKVIDVVLNVGMRDVAISKIRHMRNSGELTNIDTIKYLESKLQFDLSDDSGKE